MSTTNKPNKEINIPPETENTINITKTQFEQLKRSGETSTIAWLHTLDEYDELLGNGLNLEKMIVERIDTKGTDTEDEDIALLKAVNNHVIQIFLRRHNIKMQIASKFNTSVQETNEKQT